MKNSTTLFDAMTVQDNYTNTDNGALAFKSTNSALLDFFNSGASFRNAFRNAFSNTISDSRLEQLHDLVLNAWNEDQSLTIKLLFYFRDIRGKGIGMGERNVFIKSFSFLIKKFPTNHLLLNAIKEIAEYGCWQDVVKLYEPDDSLASHSIAGLIKSQISNDILILNKQKTGSISNLAKWLPSENTSSADTRAKARQIYRTIFKVKPARYRKMLSALRKEINIVESKLCNKQYDFNYSHVPSKAMMKYRKAFARNDQERFSAFLGKVQQGEVKMNMGTTYPYEIIGHLRTGQRIEDNMLETAWEQMPNYAINGNFIALCDCSGSMQESVQNSNTLRCIDMSVGISLFIARNNTGIFKDKFISFAEEPKLIDIAGLSISDAAAKARQLNDVTTNIERVFDLILNSAVMHKIDQSEMPEAIVLVSDMEFNSVGSYDTWYMGKYDDTIVGMIERKYNIAGYQMPKLIFWNVSQHCKHNAVTRDIKNTIVINGYKPGMFEQMLANQTPYEFMLEILNNERYSRVG